MAGKKSKRKKKRTKKPKVKTIKKTKKLLKKKPNLESYEKMRKKFDWKDYKHEVTWRGRGLNMAHAAVDCHVEDWKKNKVALYWEGDGYDEAFTFMEISELSNKFANALKSLDVKRGDRVFIFLPRIPPLYISFLGILKTGAIAGTMFAAFGPSGIKDRLQNSGAEVVITDETLKKRIYKVKRELPDLKHMIIVGKTKGNEKSYEKLMSKASDKFRVARTKPTDDAFMLYTSGTTGKPKGVVHKHFAILQEHLTAKWVLDLQPDDVYWCTADPGWVTGVAYGILGSWTNAASSVVYSGRFNPEKWYSILDKYNVTVWYTAPTAIRMLMAAGDKLPKKYKLNNLRHMCSVGEPLNPEAIWWGMKVFGLPFHDNWWQTETGGILISNYPSMDIKPGSMGKPLPWVTAAIINDKGKKLDPFKEGHLAIKPGWPSMMKKIWRRPKKYKSYFMKGWYISGDRATRDRDGYFWFIGRADDVIKTSGERVGPFEVESALVEHPAVVEAGVIGKPDMMRGEIIKAFVVLAKGYKPSESLEKQLKVFVKKHLAGHAYPREIEFAKSLPKTRSGKIMRRVLKARELGLPVGDTSTLVEF
jgi:acetyl-CoA synthetase